MNVIEANFDAKGKKIAVVVSRFNSFIVESLLDGAIDALNFSKVHQLSDHDGRMIAWLVKYHLLMSVTAQRRDISDPDVIKRFAEIVRDEAHLDYLYCLTVADMRATNESLWNSWKANLLEELYFNTKRAFRRGLEKQVDLRAKIRENQEQALEIINTEIVNSEKLNEIWREFKADYFLRYAPKQIAWHSKHILKHDKNMLLVLISPKPYRGGTEVFVYTKDKPYIFFNIVSLLGSKMLSIHDAKVTTTKDGYTANTFVILDKQGKAINDSYRALAISQALIASLSDSYCAVKAKPLAKKLEQFKIPTQVSFIATSTKNRTMLEIVALDHPGLLANIAQTFQTCNIHIHSAKITTFGEKVEDVFTVSNAENLALNDDEQQKLTAILCEDNK